MPVEKPTAASIADMDSDRETPHNRDSPNQGDSDMGVLVVTGGSRGIGAEISRLRVSGHQVDCWTIDHGTPHDAGDFVAAVMADCNQVTTNTAAVWANSKLVAYLDNGAVGSSRSTSIHTGW
jgi:hypothetical protein